VVVVLVVWTSLSEELEPSTALVSRRQYLLWSRDQHTLV